MILLASQGASQDLDLVDWKVSFEGDEKVRDLVFDADIADGWHLYGLKLDSDEGPLPTEFTFESFEGVKFKGKVKERWDPIEKHDPNFDVDVKYFETKAGFSRRFKLLRSGAKVAGYVTFMLCNDERCLPPKDHKFTITIE